MYLVSSAGRVRSTWQILNPTPNDSGYLTVSVRVDGKRKTRPVHRLVAEAFHGAPGIGQITRHLNGVRSDNRAANLCWGTGSENNADTLRHGNHQFVNRTECPKGHTYDTANTQVYQGQRRCRSCLNARGRQTGVCPRCNRTLTRSTLFRHQAVPVCPPEPGKHPRTKEPSKLQTVYELTKDVYPLRKGGRVVPNGDKTVWNNNQSMLWVNTNENPDRKFVVRPDEIVAVDE